MHIGKHRYPPFMFKQPIIQILESKTKRQQRQQCDQRKSHYYVLDP